MAVRSEIRLRRLNHPAWIAVAVAASTALVPSPSPSANVDATGIVLIDVGEQVQARPVTEEIAVAISDAMVLAEANGDDLGYPWIDPASGELVLSAVTPRGRDLIEAADITVPRRVRDVAYGATELERIQHDATFLRSRGVRGAELIYLTMPDHRDNRTLIVISAMSRPLLDYLAEHYPVDAIAVQVDAGGAPVGAP